MDTNAQALLAVIQPVANTPVAPSIATDAVLTSSIDITPLVAEYKDRNIIQPYYGSKPKIVTGEHVQLSFEVELAGQQGLGVPNEGLSTLLQICTWQENIVASTSIDHALAGSNFSMGTLRFYYDNQLHEVSDARGSVSFSFSATALPSYKFTILGLYSPVTVASVGAQDITMFRQPVEVNSANTAFSLLGQVVELISLDLDLGVKTKFKDLPGGTKQIAITGRDVTGSVKFVAPSVAVFDWFTQVRSATTGPLNIQHGPVQNRVILNGPTVQPTDPKYGDDDGELTMELSLAFLPSSAGNDELTHRVL